MEMNGAYQKVDDLMNQAVGRLVFPGGVLLVAVQGSIVFERAYGSADLFSRRPITCSTVFDLASLTKPLATTLAVMRLVQEGRLDLDQPCRHYWPGLFREEKASITARQLLCHSSGLPPWRPYYLRLRLLPNSNIRREVLKEWVAKEALLSAPGGKACYSDIGFLMLQWLVEGLADQPLDRYLERTAWKEMAAKELFFNPDSDAVRKGTYAATELCPWRGRLLLGRVHDDNAYVLGGVAGHAGLFGTAHNVWGLLQSMLSLDAGESAGAPVDQELLRHFFRRQNGTTWALGFDTPDEENSSAGHYFGNYSIGHLGYTGTSFWMERQKGIVVILLTNRVHPTRYNTRIRNFRPILHDAVMEAAGSI